MLAPVSQKTAVPATLFTDGSEASGVLQPDAVIPPPRPTGIPVHDLVFVTPRIAEHWISHVVRERPKASGTVQQYKRDMLNDNWRGDNGESLSLSAAQAGLLHTPECERHNCSRRELLEGLQRLTALVLAAEENPEFTGLWLDIAFDVDPGTMHTINTGRPRSYRDRRAIEGLDTTYSNALGTVLRRIVAWQARGVATGAGSFKASSSEMDQVYKDHPDADEAAQYAARVYEKTRLPTSAMGFGYWLLNQISSDDAGQFFERIAGDGSNLPPGDPALLFRDRIMRDRNLGKKLNEPVVLALLFLAWNELRARKENAQKRLIARSAGRRPIKVRPNQGKLQLPDGGKLTARNFPAPQ